MANSLKKLVSAIRTSLDRSPDRNYSRAGSGASSPKSFCNHTTPFSSPFTSAHQTPSTMTPRSSKTSLNELFTPILHHSSLLPLEEKVQPLALLEPGTTRSLADLPTELITIIANMSGFTSSLKLSMTCKRLRTIIMTPSSWYDYTTYTMDVIESKVSIITKLSTFDHLLFGIWPKVEGNASLPEDPWSRGCGRLPSSDSVDSVTTLTNRPTLYRSCSLKHTKRGNRRLFFEHRAFSNHFDFLGGVEFDVQDNGHIAIEFFDHVETLPCRKCIIFAFPTLESRCA